MTQVQKSLLLAAAMIGIAILAVAGIVPEETARYAPVAMAVLLPWAIGGTRSCCGTAR